MWMSVLCYQQTTASLTVRTLLAVTIVSVGRVSHWVPIKEPASVGVLVILLRGLVLYYKYQNLLFFFLQKSMRSVSLGVWMAGCAGEVNVDVRVDFLEVFVKKVCKSVYYSSSSFVQWLIRNYWYIYYYRKTALDHSHESELIVSANAYTYKLELIWLTTVLTLYFRPIYAY